MAEERDPKPGEVWRSRDRREPGRTVLVLDVVEVPSYGWFVELRSLTGYDGRTLTRAPRTEVRLANWHKLFEFEREADRG